VLSDYSNLYDDVLIINLSSPVEFIISQIMSCEKTISSSLHGLVVSHAHGIGSRWVEFSNKVTGDGFKFRDYFTTVETNPSPLDLRNRTDLKLIEAEIPGHSIVVNQQELLSQCPF